MALPAAVPAGPALTDQQSARASRQLALPGFDELAQRRLANARVLVIGAGGLGSASVPYLAGSGVGTIGLVDDDLVELSNLHRQVAHSTASIGTPKTASLAERVRQLDPGITVIEHQLRLDASNALEIFSGYDLVIDGSDNFPTRYLANDAAQLSGIPLVWGAILGTHGQVSVAWHEHGPGYRDLFPVPPAPGTVANCAEGGVLPGLCGTVGTLLATEALKLITGLGEPLSGRVLSYDALAARTREIPYGRDPQGTAVTQLADYELFCNGGLPAPEPGELGGFLLDVRTGAEWAQGHVAGARHWPLDQLEAALDSGAELDLPSEVLVYCAREPRSIRAASRLLAAGITARYLPGGITALAGTHPELIEMEQA